MVFLDDYAENGNFDKNKNGRKVHRIVTDRSFPCFGEGCMNQPLVYHNNSRVVHMENYSSLVGGFYGSYGLYADLTSGIVQKSFFSVTWTKNISTGSWIMSQKLTTSARYAWLMLYLRADATKGFNGGYHYDGRGITKRVCSILLMTVKVVTMLTYTYSLFSPGRR